MTDTEWLARLDADFGKLQRNRQQVPLEKLETTYAKSYKALIGRLTEAADWFADRYLQTLTEHWPRHPKDTAGNEWLERKVAAIVEEENRAGKGNVGSRRQEEGTEGVSSGREMWEEPNERAEFFLPACGNSSGRGRSGPGGFWHLPGRNERGL